MPYAFIKDIGKRRQLLSFYYAICDGESNRPHISLSFICCLQLPHMNVQFVILNMILQNAYFPCIGSQN